MDVKDTLLMLWICVSMLCRKRFFLMELRSIGRTVCMQQSRPLFGADRQQTEMMMMVEKRMLNSWRGSWFYRDKHSHEHRPIGRMLDLETFWASFEVRYSVEVLYSSVQKSLITVKGCRATCVFCPELWLLWLLYMAMTFAIIYGSKTEFADGNLTSSYANQYCWIEWDPTNSGKGYLLALDPNSTKIAQWASSASYLCFQEELGVSGEGEGVDIKLERQH